MKRVGFTPSWMTNEEEEVVAEVFPMQQISTEQAQNEPSLTEQFPNCTPAHLEVKQRMIEATMVITGSNFAKMKVDKRTEFVNELAWLVALDAELTIRK
jgi:hypothetical protein